MDDSQHILYYHIQPTYARLLLSLHHKLIYIQLKNMITQTNIPTFTTQLFLFRI